jgi:hypothetical protein
VESSAGLTRCVCAVETPHAANTNPIVAAKRFINRILAKVHQFE